MRLQKQTYSQHQGTTYPLLAVLLGVLKADLLDFIMPPFPGPHRVLCDMFIGLNNFTSIDWRIL